MELKEIDNLNKYKKVYLTYKIFDYWNKGLISESFLPKDFNINNIEDIIKVYYACSKIEEDNEVNNILEYFINLDFYQKLDFMIYLFDIVNDLRIVPNYIKDNLSLKDLSDIILQYKLHL